MEYDIAKSMLKEKKKYMEVLKKYLQLICI